MEKKYICFIKTNDNPSEAEKDEIDLRVKKIFEETILKTILIFGDAEIKIFNQETGEVVDI